jgi:hypothetical protein
MAQKVHIGIVLDRSGSMEDCRTDAIGAVNSYLRQVRDDAEMDARVSLIIFDSQGIDTIRDRVSVRSCAELSEGEYQPRAQTPLLDAVGHGASQLDRHKQPGERCILAVMTDGLENASHEHTKETIKALLDRKQKEDGWLVVYLGAGHDAWAQAHAMGLHAGNVAGFSKKSVSQTLASLSARSARYAKAPDPYLDAAAGGFTDEERAAMQQKK